MRLAGKVALISGAASGMGAATARRFGAEGAKVVVADVLAAEGEAVVAAIRAAGGEASFIRLDVTEEAGWRSAVEATVAAYGKLDIAVNNAGISGSKVTDTMETEAWHRLMAVNATGVFLGMKFQIRRCSAPAAARSSTSRQFPAMPARTRSISAIMRPRARCGS